MSKPKLNSKSLSAIGLALVLNFSISTQVLAGTQPTDNNQVLDFIANQLGLGSVLTFFSDSLTKASSFMESVSSFDINLLKDIQIGADGLQIGEKAEAKLNEILESSWSANSYSTPDIGGAKSQYYLSQAEALGRFRTSEAGQKDAVENAKAIGAASDRSSTAVTDSDNAQSTFERTNQLNKNINTLTVTSSMNAKLALENNRLQSLAVASNAAAQKTAARKSEIETQDNQIRNRVMAEESMSTVLSGPAFIKPK